MSQYIKHAHSAGDVLTQPSIILDGSISNLSNYLFYLEKVVTEEQFEDHH